MIEFQIADEIELRPFIEENAAEIFAAVKANYAHLQPFLHWVTEDYSLESASEFINRTQKSLPKRRVRHLAFFTGKKSSAQSVS